MPKATDFVPHSRLYACFKGEPGSGKSIAAASFAARGDVEVIDFDGKFGAIHNFYTEIYPRPDILARMNFTIPATYNEGMEKLEQLAESPSFNKPGNTVIMDTLTTGVDMMLVNISKVKGVNVAKDKLKFVGGIQVNDIEDYMAETSSLTKLVQGTKFGMKCNFILIAHVVQVRSENLKGEIKVTRQLITAGKKIAAKLPAYFDEIYHFDSETEFGDLNAAASRQKYFAYTQHSGEDFARTGLKLPNKIDFTNKAFSELWYKELEYIKL